MVDRWWKTLDVYSFYSVTEWSDGRLISTGMTGIQVWSLETRMCELHLYGGEDYVLRAVELSDGRLASFSSSNDIKIWSLKTGECEQLLKGHTKRVPSGVAMSDGRLASCSDDGNVRVWNCSSGLCEEVLNATDDGRRSRNSVQLNSLCYMIQLADGRLAAATDKCIRIWSLESQREQILRGHTDTIHCVVELENGWLASTGRDRSIRIWSLVDGQCVQVLEGRRGNSVFESGDGHSDTVSHLVWLHDRRLVSSSYDNTIKVWHSPDPSETTGCVVS